MSAQRDGRVKRAAARKTRSDTSEETGPSGLQNCEKMNFCLSHPVCGVWLWHFELRQVLSPVLAAGMAGSLWMLSEYIPT